MKVALAQINTTPGDFEQHTSKIMEMIYDAVDNHQADVLVFPELATCGYLSADLMYRTEYVEKNLKVLFEEIVHESARFDMTIVIGYLDRNATGAGKPFTNSAAVIRSGAVIARYDKQLLPFYDVFDEGRYYQPGDRPCIFHIGDVRCGVAICEDVWNDKGQDDYNYKDNPVEEYHQLGCEVLISLNSSPFAVGKPRQRLEMLEEISRETGMTVVYCNQIGAQDELIFDGHSTVISQGRPVIFSDRWDEELLVVEDHRISGRHADETARKINSALQNEVVLREAIIMGLREYVQKSGFKQVVLGSSGGIDSAVVAALACEALGPENVTCIMMPSKWSSEGSVNDAKKLHRAIGCKELTVPIEHTSFLHRINCDLGFEEIHDMEEMPGPKAGQFVYKKLVNYYPVADENIQARMRGMIVMHYSNATGALPLTTGNKTEMALGYCTLYGDMNGGFNPICDLYKMQVYQLAKILKVPREIIDKPPSAELAPGQTDEQGLKLPYTILDSIVRAYIEYHVYTFEAFSKWINQHPRKGFGIHNQKTATQEWVEKDKQAEELFASIIRRIDLMEFKRRQAAPGLKISRVAFGTGRRIPIVKKV